MAYVLKQYSKLYLWQTIQTKEVRLIVKGLASNHTSKHTKKGKQKKQKVEGPLLLKVDVHHLVVRPKLHLAEEVLLPAVLHPEVSHRAVLLKEV